MEPGEYKGNRILVYLCIAHHILKCFPSYVFAIAGFSKRYMSTATVQFKVGRQQLGAETEGTEQEGFGTHTLKEMGRGGSLSFSST